eukprot:gene4881-23276_t
MFAPAPAATGPTCNSTEAAVAFKFSGGVPSSCSIKTKDVWSPALFTARMDSMITASPGTWQFAVKTNGAVRLWIDDHILVDSSCGPGLPANTSMSSVASNNNSNALKDHPRKDTPACATWDVDNISHHLDQGLHLRLEWFHYGVEEAVLELLWRRSSSSLASSAASSFVAVPGSAFKTKLPRSEVWRQQVQAKLSRGWNTWMRDSAARHLHLPSYAGVEIFLFDSKTNTTFSKGLVDKCQGTDPRACLVRPGFHSFNGSYTSYEQRTAWYSTGDVAMSVTIASGHVDGTDGNSNVVTITPTPITNTLWAIVAFNFHFDCGIVSAFEQENASLAACGSIAVHDKKGASGAVLTPVGQHPVHFKIATTTNEGVVGASTTTAEDRSSLPPGLVLPPNAMAIPLASGSPIAITAVASGGASLELDPSKAAKVIASRKKELVAGLDAEYPRKNPTTVPGGELRDSIEAIRSFGVNPWIMWDWDTYFLSLMAAESDKWLGYSNVLTVTRGRTINGQVPNAECAQWTNDDRSEPYVGAMTVREHYRKFGDIELLELLYDDLKTWNTWVLEKRSLQPAGLISVGSDPVNTASAPHP